MGQPKRATAEIPQARFHGARWTVAMCDREWRIFCGLMPDARRRLTVTMEEFCEAGCEHVPESAFHWLAPAPGDHPDVRRGSFEAHGVAIHGRRAPGGDGRPTFFATYISIDPPGSAPPAKPRRPGRDDRQGRLPLGKREN